jgi:hypothetical protein
MTERVIQRSDGLWTVFAKDADALRSLSYHDRRDDALARVTTILSAAPEGGRWVVIDEQGREIASGKVPGREEPTTNAI